MSFQNELIRQVTSTERRMDKLPEPEVSAALVSPFRALPGLRGFWTLGAFDGAGNAEQWPGAAFGLVYNGNPTYNYDGIVPYIAFDGVGDYLTRADEVAISITAVETYVAPTVRGITWGGWFYPKETGTQEHVFSKWGAAGQRSYALRYEIGDAFTCLISDDGTNSDAATAADVSAIDNWHFVVGRFDPAAWVSVFVNNVEAMQATARASIFDSNTSLDIGGRGAGSALFEGRASLCFLCAAYLSDAIISSLFQQTRSAFRV